MLLKKDPLKRESSEVREVQEMLNKALDNVKRLAAADSSLPSLPPMLGEYPIVMQDRNLHHKKDVPIGWNIIQEDGIFWTETENAVICFKDFFYLAREIDAGVVGDTTYSKLKELSSINSCDIQILGTQIYDSNNSHDTQILGTQINDSNLIDKVLEFVSNVSLAHELCKFIDDVIVGLEKYEEDVKVFKKQENRYEKSRKKGQLKKEQCKAILKELKQILVDTNDRKPPKPNTKQVEIFLKKAQEKLKERIDDLSKNKSKFLDKLPYKIAVIIKKYPRIVDFIKFFNKIPGLQWAKVLYHLYKSNEAFGNRDFEKGYEELSLFLIFGATNIITDKFVESGNFRLWLICFILFFVLEYLYLNDSEDTLFPTRNIIRDLIK